MRTRNAVERSIGLLKSRFRCLLHKENALPFTPEKAVKIIIACCVLHNIAIQFNLPDPEEIELDEPHVPGYNYGDLPELLGGRDVIARLLRYQFQ